MKTSKANMNQEEKNKSDQIAKTKKEASLETRQNVKPQLPFESRPKKQNPNDQNHDNSSEVYSQKPTNSQKLDPGTEKKSSSSFQQNPNGSVYTTDSRTNNNGPIKILPHDSLSADNQFQYREGFDNNDIYNQIELSGEKLMNWNFDFSMPDMTIKRKNHPGKISVPFLKNNVFDDKQLERVLVHGLLEINEIRPENPIRHLGEFLQNNRDKEFPDIPSKDPFSFFDEEN